MIEGNVFLTREHLQPVTLGDQWTLLHKEASLGSIVISPGNRGKWKTILSIVKVFDAQRSANFPSKLSIV